MPETLKQAATVSDVKAKSGWDYDSPVRGNIFARSEEVKGWSVLSLCRSALGTLLHLGTELLVAGAARF